MSAPCTEPPKDWERLVPLATVAVVAAAQQPLPNPGAGLDALSAAAAVAASADRAPPPVLAPARVEAPLPANVGDGGGGGAAAAAEVEMSAEDKEKVKQKSEKYPPSSVTVPAAAAAVGAAAAGAPARAGEKKGTDDVDMDVVEIAPFAGRPSLESGLIFGRSISFSREMKMRPRDIPVIETFVRRVLIRAFECWVIYRRRVNDRETGKQRQFGELRYLIDEIVQVGQPFVNTPAKLSLALDLVEEVYKFLMGRAAAEQNVHPPNEPSVPAITVMQQALLKAGVDTTFETTRIDVVADDILCKGHFQCNLQPMAIFKGTPGVAGVLERREADKRMHEEAEEEERAAKRQRRD